MAAGPDPTAPILVVPYMWIGDFVRCHTVVRLLRARFPASPIDVLTTNLEPSRRGGLIRALIWALAIGGETSRATATTATNDRA